MHFHHKTKCIILIIAYHFSFRDIVHNNNTNNNNNYTDNDNSNKNNFIEDIGIITTISNMNNAIFYRRIANSSKYQLFPI